MQVLLDSLGSFPAGLATGVLVALLGLAGKYFIDYRLESRRLRLEERRYGSEEEQARWRLRAEARGEVYAAVGSTQASLVRAAVELHDRLSNFLENVENTRPWLKPATTPEKDGYYLKEFVRRIFNFHAWGGIAQYALNSLPVELVQERDDLQRLYTFVNLANSLLTYTWLFRGVEEYKDKSENLHLFTGSLARLTEMGVSAWKQTDGALPQQSFDEPYAAGEGPLRTLRDMLAAAHAEEDGIEEHDHRAALVIARLAALRAALAAYLSIDHAWALVLSEEQSIAEQFASDLEYASSLAPSEPELPQLVRRNLHELVVRYRCEWLPLEGSSSSRNGSTNKG